MVEQYTGETLVLDRDSLDGGVDVSGGGERAVYERDLGSGDSSGWRSRRMGEVWDLGHVRLFGGSSSRKRRSCARERFWILVLEFR